MKQTIGVVGAGRLGLSFALLCDSVGHSVHVYDINETRCEQIKNKTLKTTEPQIETLLKDSHLNVRSNLKSMVSECDLIFLFVATPSMENGEYDHSQIEQVIKEIDGGFNGGLGITLVISCTTMPTYCASLQKRIKHLGISIIYNPEFIAQGNIIYGLKNSDIVLIGGNPPVGLCDLYRSIMTITPEFKILSLTGAEIAKIGINCFLTTKISYANMIGEIAINSGEEKNVTDILSAIGSDKRIGTKFLNYGFGYGGVCLPRDNRALGIHAENVGINPIIQDAVDEFNDIHLDFIKWELIEKNPDKNIPFIINQLSYKKGVDIITESKHLELCKELLDEGYKVNIVESEAVIELVKPELAKYGDRVTYGNGHGTVSDFEERMIAGQRLRGYVIEL